MILLSFGSHILLQTLILLAGNTDCLLLYSKYGRYFLNPASNENKLIYFSLNFSERNKIDDSMVVESSVLKSRGSWKEQEFLETLDNVWNFS